MPQNVRKAVADAELAYLERIGSRVQAGVRCPRCRRVIPVEWEGKEPRRGGTNGSDRTSARSLGRCTGCFRPYRAAGRKPARRGDGDGDVGYVHVVREPDGSLSVGAWPGDRRARLAVLVTGVASCGCCHVTLVRCGGCGLPVATVHKAPETYSEAELCGYCQCCDRLIHIRPAEPSAPDALRFFDEAASPEEITASRRGEWRDRLRFEMHDVDGWTTMRATLPRELLDLVELSHEAIEFVGRDGPVTWEAWLADLGRASGRDHDPGPPSES